MTEWSIRASSLRPPKVPVPAVTCLPNTQLTKTLATDNVDYNSLKYEIKVNTRRDQARAMAIPGHRDAALSRFEEGFYEELCAQHDRVDLFVTSKAAEIDSRLGASTHVHTVG